MATEYEETRTATKPSQQLVRNGIESALQGSQKSVTLVFCDESRGNKMSLPLETVEGVCVRGRCVGVTLRNEILNARKTLGGIGLVMPGG